MAADILILLLVFGYGGFVLYRSHRQKKAGGGGCSGCSGCCGTCQGCGNIAPEVMPGGKENG